MLCWWCCYFLGLFFVGAVNFRAWYFLAGWFFVGCCFLWCDGFWWFFGLGCFWFGDGFNFLGGWFLFRFCWFLLVSVLLDAVRCCFYIGALVGLVVWFLWRFWAFVEFCQVVPFPICKFLNFVADWFIVQLGTPTALIFYFSKALGWMWLLNYCNFIFWFCNSFFWFSLAFTIDFFIN